MPVLASSAYNTAEDVLNRMRVILNDAEVPGGDVLTDTNPQSFQLLNSGFERVQMELAIVGVEVSLAEFWFIGLPIMPSIDPEARMIIDDTGTSIIYPNGTGNVFSLAPQLPPDLVLPLRCWERQTGTSNPVGPPMKQPNGGLHSTPQQNFLGEWIWESDGIRTRGAMQSQDMKVQYEKRLAQLSSPSDPVPIRGVVNAAAYWSAQSFAESRGGLNAPAFLRRANEEVMKLQQISARRRQRIQTRRRPYSGKGSRQQRPTL
jgi:hypothetical protein